MNTIFAADKFWGLGKKNDLLFHLSKDMQHFIEHTRGKTVVMGYNTLLSLPKGMPLKNRKNIVLYPQGDYADAEQKGYILVKSLEELFSEINKGDKNNTYVIGGAMMYRTMLPYCDYAYVTRVDADGQAEVFHEDLDTLSNWSIIEQSQPIDDNGYSIKFVTYANSSPLPL